MDLRTALAAQRLEELRAMPHGAGSGFRNESLPEGAGLSGLGAWKFRGLPEPVDMFQVDAPDLVAGFPPLRSAVPAG